MKKRYIFVLSLLIGLLAMALWTTPMWWGVLFSPISHKLTTAPVTEELTKGFFFQTEGFVFRLKGLDLLGNLFQWFQ